MSESARIDDRDPSPLELIFLGTGTSAGVPMIGCDCATCCSDDPRDQRDRPSVLIRVAPPAGVEPFAFHDILIDTSPDLRHQAIRERLMRIDGVVYTHAHADHIFGLDDLRRFNAVMESPIDIYAEATALRTLRRMFPYIFESHKNVNPSFVASLIAHEIEVEQSFDLCETRWTPLRLMHGRLPILGFRVDYQGRAIAYCTDVSTIPPQTYPLLEGLDVLVIDALRFKHHPTHLTVDQALEVVAATRPKQAFFTHIAHDIRHASVSEQLPAGVAIAYDGLHVCV